MTNPLDVSCTSIGFCMQDRIPTPILKGGLNSLGLSLSIYLDDYVGPSPSHHMISVPSLSYSPNVLDKVIP